MKIYTKQGDKGKTTLLGGKIVSKSHKRIDAYGTLDELISYIGLIRSLLKNQEIVNILVKIQDRLMVMASILATDEDEIMTKLPLLKKEDTALLEKEIDSMEHVIPPLKTFILPGGDTLAAHCHIARTITRRVERKIIGLHEEAALSENILVYINRLSDYFFVLARKLAFDKNINEIQWNPDL